MIKTKIKLVLCLFLLIVLYLGQTFATETATNIISEENTQEAVSTTAQNNNFKNEDLYISNVDNYNLKDIIIGNAFISSDELILDPSENGGTITGNLFATSSSVNLKSSVTYSEEGTVDNVSSASSINGNAYIVTEKFVLEPGCEINGDLYIVANEINIAQNSIIYGNIFAVANNFKLEGQVGGDLYITGKDFNMSYYGFVYRDLHLSCENANLDGVSYRSCFANVKNFTTSKNFVCNGNMNITAFRSTISGEITGNADITSKTLEFKNKDGEENITCKINGKLNYSSANELDLKEFVNDEITFSKYVEFSSIWPTILGALIKFANLAICVIIIYLLLNKLSPVCLEKLSNFEVKKLLIGLGIGILSLIIIPIICILLLITTIGAKLAVILFIILALIYMISVPTLIVSFAKFLTAKYTKTNIFVWLLAIPFVLCLVKLIPYVGFVVSILLISTGFGKLVLSLFNKKD